ncbi:winged helix-turn-helix domain-containing protein [Pseudomonas sp. MH9.2]|uniref:winged helix-turn-helix domain-containing protein n=1 Tax=unclassified Pseudomonas TaxID=196821 RepID=UPI002AC97E77|nr:MULTISPECIES: winged helix-turn-helix domain-containing protein [unclassified Pseudomonas]MEB0029052.1 winged helix-turn-helix domain-containing protein [Pseudomonas sp. MH9.2]MEB0150579.1 winged helix-turn-helix domain-containing protein [Pseudomonas sp. CCC2.2]MEE3509600.1 winged helix-turn-helix domain-containing protein [Pseudomonas sp. 10C3]WPX68888.1 winged helix-turn-helix domain-containing protein [Pseudomonas sp. MH9.2]
MDYTSCSKGQKNTVIVAFGHTQALAEGLRQLTVSETVHVDVLEYSTPLDKISDIASASAIIIEIDAPACLNEGLELVKKIRTQHFLVSIIVLITHTKPFKKVSCYIAGVDHCITIPAERTEKENFLSKAFHNFELEKKIHLVLDRTCLCLRGHLNKLEISYTEMKVLDALICAKQHILSHDDIARVLELNIKFYDPRALEKKISRLRSKIKSTYDINAIQNVRGFGYRLCRGIII